MFPHLFIIFSMICYFDFLIIKVLETLNEFFFFNSILATTVLFYTPVLYV